jgi:diguanylate cyclase (GGDEF)-like protein
VEQVSGGIEGLALAVTALARCRSVEEVREVVGEAARPLTGCDGATLVLREGESCFYAEEDAPVPLWKGQRVPLDSSVGGWAMLNGEPAVVADVLTDPRTSGDRYQETFVKSLVMVPVRAHRPLGAIGNYWAQRHEPTSVELSLLQALADATAVALENIKIRAEMEEVADRTAVVTAVNRQLEQEIEEHWKFAAEVYRQSVTDELTGLLNRRGFFKRAELELASLRENGRPGLVLFMDVDGLKELNDTEGHDAGDQLLCETAELLHELFRADDVLARIGGDEFAVFVPGYADLHRAVARLRAQAGRVQLSIGSAVFDPDAPRGLYELLGEADSDMYEDKRARRAG